MIQSKFSLFKELEQLQVDGSLPGTCLVGASSRVKVNGSMVVIVPDASDKIIIMEDT